jgi:hypothetical protein
MRFLREAGTCMPSSFFDEADALFGKSTEVARCQPVCKLELFFLSKKEV